MGDRCRICGTTLPQRDGRCAVCGDPGEDRPHEAPLYSPAWWAEVAAGKLRTLTHVQGLVDRMIEQRDAEIAVAVGEGNDPHGIAERWDARIVPTREEVRRLHEEWLAAREWAGRPHA